MSQDPDTGTALAAPTSLESVVSRHRAFVLVALAGTSAAGWAYSLSASVDRSFHELLSAGVWNAWSFTMVFVMWSMMMVAMMVPSAAPMILTYATLQRTRRTHHGDIGARGAIAVASFVIGYLAVWTAFSFVATLAQWLLQRSALITAAGESASLLFTGALLLTAGLFQWTPWKRACLRHCRSPFAVLMTSWRDGPRGALAMGVEHGAYCVGCCWALMALMFVAGVMNILWLAAIALLVLLEKLLPAGDIVGRATGALMAGCGVYATWLGFVG